MVWKNKPDAEVVYDTQAKIAELFNRVKLLELEIKSMKENNTQPKSQTMLDK